MYKGLILDEEDIKKCRWHSWHLNKGYLRASKVGYIHRYILGITDPKLIVDHLNGNKLDNRKSNLRVGTQADNMNNQWFHRDNVRELPNNITRSGKEFCIKVTRNRKTMFARASTLEESIRIKKEFISFFEEISAMGKASLGEPQSLGSPSISMPDESNEGLGVIIPLRGPSDTVGYGMGEKNG